MPVLGLLLETGREEEEKGVAVQEEKGVAVPGKPSGTAGRGLTVR